MYNRVVYAVYVTNAHALSTLEKAQISLTKPTSAIHYRVGRF